MIRERDWIRILARQEALALWLEWWQEEEKSGK